MDNRKSSFELRDFLLSSIGIDIDDLFVKSNHEMILRFNSGSSLLFLDNEGGFENFLFKIDGEDYLV